MAYFQGSQKFGALLLNAVLIAGLTACGPIRLSGSKDGIYVEPDSLLNPGKQSELRLDQLNILFPVVGKTTFEDDWHAPRDGGARQHIGNDLIAKKLTPVVAVADGVVSWIHAKKGGECCYLGIVHETQGLKYETRYIHLNNDTPGTDDGKVVGIAKGIKKGAKVKAGQLIGWVGDSGNAEDTVSHLHFEIHDENGNPIDPYKILLRAQHMDRIHAEDEDENQKSITPPSKLAELE